MKRMLMIVLICTLLCPAALADTLQEQVNAPEHINDEFQSPSGKTRVYVDADVLVPDVPYLSVYGVTPRVFIMEEAAKGVEMHFADGAWIDANSGTTELVMDRQSGDRGVAGGVTVFPVTEDGVDSLHWLYAGYEQTSVAGADYYTYNIFEICNEHGGRGGDPGDEATARAVADAFVQALWPDMVYYGTDPKQSGLPNLLSGQTCYRFHYARLVDGVLVTPVFQDGAYEMLLNWEGRVFSLPLPYEKLYVDVDENGIFGLRYEYPINKPVLETENVTLLSFSEIWQIAEQVAPMTIMYNEQYEAVVDNALFIERVELGYMCVPKMDEPGHYQLIPVWDFFGRRILNDQLYDQYNNALLTINAMDGTVIDRQYGY